MDGSFKMASPDIPSTDVRRYHALRSNGRVRAETLANLTTDDVQQINKNLASLDNQLFRFKKDALAAAAQILQSYWINTDPTIESVTMETAPVILKMSRYVDAENLPISSWRLSLKVTPSYDGRQFGVYCYINPAKRVWESNLLTILGNLRQLLEQRSYAFIYHNGKLHYCHMGHAAFLENEAAGQKIIKDLKAPREEVLGIMHGDITRKQWLLDMLEPMVRLALDPDQIAVQFGWTQHGLRLAQEAISRMIKDMGADIPAARPVQYESWDMQHSDSVKFSEFMSAAAISDLNNLSKNLSLF